MGGAWGQGYTHTQTPDWSSEGGEGDKETHSDVTLCIFERISSLEDHNDLHKYKQRYYKIHIHAHTLYIVYAYLEIDKRSLQSALVSWLSSSV